MQAPSLLPLPPSFRDSDERAEVSGKFAHDFMAKLNIDDHNEEDVKGNEDEDEDEDEEEEEEEEFSFVCINPDGSPISADEVFDNGQIRPIFPVFNQDLLFADEYDGADALRSPFRKLFVQQPDEFPPSSSSPAVAPEPELLEEAPEGPYCEWSGKKAAKSNSTGFSKLWRFRDLKLRSNSDGKDAFVFLNPSAASGAKQGSSGAVKAEKTSSGEAKSVVVKKKVKEGKGKTASSAHEKHYVTNRARKEVNKRKSYLPYRQDLVGLFANVNGLSKNVHPY